MLTGLYVHQHWPYRYPYNARTWSLEAYQGFLGGLHKLGYNMVMIWPMLETIPEDPLPSDWRMIHRLGDVIRHAQNELGMTVWLHHSANVAPIEEMAVRATFEDRHFFHSDRRINPRDDAAMDRMVERWKKLFEPLKHVDAIATIDSDPGSYPGSTNAEFIHILQKLGRMYQALNPEIELVYWAEHGWPTYARFLQKGFFEFDLHQPYDRIGEFREAFEMLRDLDLPRWGIALGRSGFEHKLEIVKELGISERCIAFNYGEIEAEPSFPMTNWWPERAHAAGKAATLRGGMGNAQNHVVQLPNIFAFACGAHSQSLTHSDYLQFADHLIPGQAELIVLAWELFASSDHELMQATRERIHRALHNPSDLISGPLGGLIFNEPQRYMRDLAMMLDVRRAWVRFAAAVDGSQPADDLLAEFITASETWYLRTGYKDTWWWDGMLPTFEKYAAPSINQVFIDFPGWGAERTRWATEVNTPFDETFLRLYREELATPRLLDAMKIALLERRGIH